MRQHSIKPTPIASANTTPFQSGRRTSRRTATYPSTLPLQLLPASALAAYRQAALIARAIPLAQARHRRRFLLSRRVAPSSLARLRGGQVLNLGSAPETEPRPCRV